MSSISSVGSNIGYDTIASGKRINSAADDASGLAIANKLESQTSGLEVGADNAKDGISVTRVADGAMEGITDSLQRIRELSLKASNGLMSGEDKQSIQDEIKGHLENIDQLAKGTEFNTKSLLNGSMASMDIATNPDGTGMSIQMADTTLETLGIAGYDVTGDFDIRDIDNALEMVSGARSQNGASANRLEYAHQYNTNAALQQTGAQSRLEDLDIPKAISEIKKNEVLEDYKSIMLKKKMEEESLVTRMLQ